MEGLRGASADLFLPGALTKCRFPLAICSLAHQAPLESRNLDLPIHPLRTHVFPYL